MTNVNLLIVTIIESADNENALVAPVIEVVHSVMTRRREWTEKGSEWLEAFDHLPPLMTIHRDRTSDTNHNPSTPRHAHL